MTVTLAERVVTERLSRLNQVLGLGEPLIAGHVPCEVIGDKTPAEIEWFAATTVRPPAPHDEIVLPTFKFNPKGTQ